MEGPLEVRGPGLIGRWDQKWFSVQDGTLEVFKLKDGQRSDQLLQHIELQSIKDLSFNGKKCECMFVSHGTKLRLRAKTDDSARAWFQCIQAESKNPPGARAAESKSPQHGADQAAQRPSFDHVATQRSSLDHVATQRSSLDHVATQRSSLDHVTTQRSSVDHVATQRSSVDHVTTQRSSLDHVATQRSSVAESHRQMTAQRSLDFRMSATEEFSPRASEFASQRSMAESHKSLTAQRTSELQASHRSSSELQIQHHELVAHRSSVEFHSQRSELATQQAVSHKSLTAQRTSELQASHRSSSELQIQQHELMAQRSSVEFHSQRSEMATQQVCRSATAPAPGQFISGRRSALTGDKAIDLLKDAPPEESYASSTPTGRATHAAEERRTPRLHEQGTMGAFSSESNPAANDFHLVTDTPQRIHELYALHEKKQRKLEMMRLREEEEELRRIEEQKEMLRRNRGRVGMWHPSELNPADAAERLFRDGRTGDLRRKEMQMKKLEEERLRIEEERLRARPARTFADGAQGNCKDASRRLHEDAQRRQEHKKKLDEERLVEEHVEPVKVATGNNKRHHELYADWKSRRDKLEKLREANLETERKQIEEGAVGKDRRPLDDKRIKELHDDHAIRKRKKAEIYTDHLKREQEQIRKSAEEALTRSPRPRGAQASRRQAAANVSMAVHNLGPAAFEDSPDALADLQAKVAEAIASEAGGAVKQNHVTVDITADDALSSTADACYINASIAVPSSAAGNQVVAKLLNSASFCETVAAAITDVEGLTSPSAGSVRVSDVRTSVVPSSQEQERLEMRARLEAPPSRFADLQEASLATSHAASVKVLPEPMSTTDCMLAAVLSTIQSRCGTLTYSQAEMKGLAAPLKVAITTFREALGNTEKSEGYAQLTSRESQRIFHEGHLLPEFEAWPQCIEPDPIRQVENDLDSLYAHAEIAQELMKLRITHGNAQSWPAEELHVKPAGVPMALFAYNPGLKSRERAETKALVRYGPAEGKNRFQHLVDIARLALVFATCDMMQAGLDLVLGTFEVVSVKNYFGSPGRLGLRFVEVLVVVQVELQDGSGGSLPHVCELRLEEINYHKARQHAAPHLENFYNQLRGLFARNSLDSNAMAYLVHATLNGAPEGHHLRVFRRHLARHFGSTVGAWRRELGNGRQLTFQKFRDVCQVLKCREHVTEYWQELDATHAGVISLFELDPEAASLLIKFRARAMACADYACSTDLDTGTLFERLSFMIRPSKAGQLDTQEFRMVAKPLGLTQLEVDRVFVYLDGTQYKNGVLHPPGSVTTTDIGWLKRLNSLLDIEAAALTAGRLSELESFRQLTWACKGRSRTLSWAQPRWAVDTNMAMEQMRARSQEVYGQRQIVEEPPAPGPGVMHRLSVPSPELNGEASPAHSMRSGHRLSAHSQQLNGELSPRSGHRLSAQSQHELNGEASLGRPGHRLSSAQARIRDESPENGGLVHAPGTQLMHRMSAQSQQDLGSEAYPASKSGQVASSPVTPRARASTSNAANKRLSVESAKRGSVESVSSRAAGGAQPHAVRRAASASSVRGSTASAAGRRDSGARRAEEAPPQAPMRGRLPTEHAQQQQQQQALPDEVGYEEDELGWNEGAEEQVVPDETDGYAEQAEEEVADEPYAHYEAAGQPGEQDAAGDLQDAYAPEESDREASEEYDGGAPEAEEEEEDEEEEGEEQPEEGEEKARADTLDEFIDDEDTF